MVKQQTDTKFFFVFVKAVKNFAFFTETSALISFDLNIFKFLLQTSFAHGFFL